MNKAPNHGSNAQRIRGEKPQMDKDLHAFESRIFIRVYLWLNSSAKGV
jgi:hypothetical protein